MSQDDVPIERDNHALITEDVDVATTEVPERSHEQEMVISQPAIPDSDIDPSFSTGLLILIGPALIAGIFVKSFDIAFLATSYARLASDLQHFKDGSWIVLTDSICSAVLVPLYTYSLKSLGTRRTMLVAYASLSAGLGLCAFSTTFWGLLGSRFVVGIGSSGIAVLSMITVNEIVGLKQLAFWESFGICIEMGTSMAAGPLGALIYRRFTWHSVFYLEFLAALIGLALVYYAFARISSNPQYAQLSLLSKGTSKAPRLDIKGWALLILAASIPLIALSLGDNLLSWTNPFEIMLLVSAPVLMGLFVLFEAKVAVDPIINMSPVFHLQYLRVLLQVFGAFFIFNAIAFILPPYIQVRGFNSYGFEDWALTCVLLGVPIGALFGGYLVKVEAFPVRRIMLANAILLQCLCVLFVTRVIKPESARYSPFLVILGFCHGVWQSCLLYATLSSTQKQWYPQTLALYYLIQTMGGDLGMALMSAIMRSVAKLRIRSSLGNSKATEQIIADAMQDLNSVERLNDGPRQLVYAAFEYAIHTSLFLPCAMAAAVIILATSMNMYQGKGLYAEIPSDDDEVHEDGTDFTNPGY